MSRASVNVKGLQELQKYLDTLPNKIQNNIMRGALRAGSRVIALEARTRVVERSRRLAKSVRYNTTRDPSRTKVVGYVRAGGKGKQGRTMGAFYAKFVEYGTRPHVIKAKKPGGLFGKGIMQVNHPGAKMKPFMRPAMDSKAQAAVTEMRDYVRKRLTKQGIETPAPEPSEDLYP
jgi:HK97 gp10 family phage protein